MRIKVSKKSTKINLFLLSFLNLLASESGYSNWFSSNTIYTNEEQFCSNNLNQNALHTVRMLLKIVYAKDCQSGYLRLSQLKSIDLSNRKISDLKPFSYLSNLKTIFLDKNKIESLSHLKNLNNLEFISLNHNEFELDLKKLPSSIWFVSLEGKKVSIEDYNSFKNKFLFFKHKKIETNF